MVGGIPSVKPEFTHYWEDQQIKGFHLNVNQKGNKSIIVMEKDGSLCLPCCVFDSVFTSHSGPKDRAV